ncbi:MAG TPA: mechanosensitive ion channel protein MscS [Ruminococcaceae bacterium]|nr:mechanosensitive ion channel protein MscS [Oscillospiraceae bacterium]
MEKFNEYIIDFGQKLLIFAIVLAAGFLIVKAITSLVKKALLKTKLDHTVKTFLYSFLRVILYALVVLVALNTIGIKVDSIITAIGAAALTAGLALQDTIKNFVSGMIIIFSKPFTAGDLIEFEGFEGYVQSIRIFYTAIKTYENKIVQIPNSRLTADNVTNCSAGEYRRVSLKFTVSYEDKLSLVKSVIFGVISKNDKILAEPEPKIYVSNHLDSGVEITVFVWGVPDDYFPILFYMEEEVKLAFDENGIVIPYPHVQLAEKNSNE